MDRTTFVWAIAWEREDGSGLAYAPIREEGRLEGETDAAMFGRAEANLIYLNNKKASEPWVAVRMAEIPVKEAFHPQGAEAVDDNLVQTRNCWGLENGQVVVHSGRLQNAYMKAVRSERDRRLKASDGEYMKVQEIGTPPQQANWRSYRQSLRNMPAGVQQAIAGLGLKEIKQYAPAWPSRPGG